MSLSNTTSLKDWQEKKFPDHGFLNCECGMPYWIWFPPKGNKQQSIELNCKIELSFYEIGIHIWPDLVIVSGAELEA
jgi:hypothetical protein